ncbi:MAG: O-antigen ligase family protein [Leptolyngbyaceae cyanobacterium]
MVLRSIPAHGLTLNEGPKVQARRILILEWIERFEYVFAFLSLLIYSDAVLIVIITGGASEGDGFNFLNANYTPVKLFYLANYFITLLLLAFRYKRTLYTLQSNPLFVAISLYIPLSVFWSYAPGDTFSAGIALTFSTLFGVYLASRFSLKQQVMILGYVLVTITVLSLLFAIILPKYGIMGGIHLGAWRGVFVHKNQAGKIMVMACAVQFMLFNYVKDRYHKWVFLVGIGLSFLMIIQTTSGGALINSVFVMVIVVLTRIFRAEPRKLLISVIFLAATAAFIAMAYNPLMSFTLRLIGKDPTLTGRTDIWEYILIKIGERPALGYGLAAFWRGVNGESVYIFERAGWEVPDSHHGFLDMTLQIGIIGSSMVCLALWQTLLRGIARIRLYGSWLSSWLAVYSLYIVIVNLSETSLLIQNNIFWILTASTSFTASVEAKYLVDINRFGLADKVKISEG